MTSCASFRRVSFPSLGDTSCCAISPSGRSHSRTDSLCSPGLFRDFTRKTQDLPSSRESSIVRSLLFQGPRPDQLFRPFQKTDVAPPCTTREAPTLIVISWLNSKAFELAVYASPWGLLAPDAKLASGSWSDLTGQALPARHSMKVLWLPQWHLLSPSTNFLAQGSFHF